MTLEPNHMIKTSPVAMITKSPYKVDKSGCHGRLDGGVAGTVYDSAQCVEQLPQHQDVLTQQVKSVYGTVEAAHQRKEEQRSHWCKPTGLGLWSAATLKHNFSQSSLPPPPPPPPPHPHL